MPTAALPIELDIRAYYLEFAPDSRNLVLVGGPVDSVVIYDLATRSIRFSRQIQHNVLDTTFSASGEYVFLIGEDSAAGNTALSRVSLDDGDVRTVVFDRRLDGPSVAMGPDNKLFVASYSTERLTHVPVEVFDVGANGSDNRFNFDEGSNEVILKGGTVAGIEAVPGEQIAFVSHAFERTVSAIDLITGGWIGRLNMGTQVADEIQTPLHLVATLRNGRISEQPNSIVIGDSRDGRLLIADLNEEFSSFDIIQVVDLRPLRISSSTFGKSPLLVAADTEQDVILVGSQNSTEVFVYSRSTRSVEVQNALKLPFRPSALDVSPRGDIAAFLDARSGRLVIYDDPAGRSIERPVDAATERIKEVQRQLSELGYPVGLVDGMDGVQTRTAIALFQRQQGLKVTGTVDDAVLAALREVAALESGKKATPEVSKEFVVVQTVINPVVQPKNVSDAIGFCAGDERCSSLADGAATFLGLPSGTVAAALAAVPKVDRNGEEGHLSIALPSGYEYCRSRIQPKSVVPATGDRASVMSARSTKDGVGIYTWTPRASIGGGRSWVEADFTIYGVREDVAEQYRANGTCREPGATLISCRGAKGTNKGQPACGNTSD
ncbi:hypothetical protein FHT79_006089 [Rhizobium sp. BK212]|uniref:peptidoglycan-binding protein n=1 Tax=Rhizobium sp. BK212 TaxID=2587074 RepID=UPI00160C676E|nr:peptidoglycan-binding protein [Rhizobium sp. BK212]MBB4218867.1 hypothetical protein [Rhizobium sp. BK212]